VVRLDLWWISRRAISLEPEFIVADEPVSPLDVSVHAQVLGLLMELHKKHSWP
jgi:ABC-type oligopeptide transport system ATPase subunit